LGVATGIEVLSVSDRDRILQAMADCCVDRGYEATTVETVLERAGVERDRFDSLFAGKEECALAALNKVVSETLARVSMLDSRLPADPARQTHEIDAILALIAARPSFIRLACVDARQCGTVRMREAYESAGHVLALMMERAAQGGRGSSFATTARGALGGAEALIRRELTFGDVGNVPRLLPNFVYAALVPFVGQREALRQAKLAARMAAEEE